VLPAQQPLQSVNVSVLGLALLLACAVAAAQSAPPVPSAVSPVSSVRAPQKSSAADLTLSNPLATLEWAALSKEQKMALHPLATGWEKLSDVQKKKWITLSANFSKMTQADQAKLHERMVQWAALSPKQREHARLNFAEAQKITPQEKNEKWQAYQALSPEDKQKLAKSAQPKPPRTALAPKPVPASQISRIPAKASQPASSAL